MKDQTYKSSSGFVNLLGGFFIGRAVALRTRALAILGEHAAILNHFLPQGLMNAGDALLGGPLDNIKATIFSN